MGSSAPGDVIAAIATGRGVGGIGIVRISGPNLEPITRSILGRVPAPRRAMHAQFVDSAGDPLDEGIALYFPAPASYTGEDVLELQGHGGPVVLQLVLRRCIELGARLAEPGEFTKRAFLNDKLDLAQAEAVGDLIEASTEAAARGALRSLRGDFSAAIGRLEDALTELRMLLEATLDFPEEEIDRVHADDARRRLIELEAALDATLRTARQGSVLRAGLQVVLAGRPNVGKSSLLNRLAGEEVAIVTPVPGTTRDTVREMIHLEGVPFHLVDTAGLRETGDSVERLGIERTWAAIERSDLLLLVIDAATGKASEDLAIEARVPSALPRIVVHNKIDLAGMPALLARQGATTEVYVSAKTGAGIELLRATLLEHAGWQPGTESVFIARERHLSALLAAATYLRAAADQLHAPELMAEELRLAHHALGTITGEFTADDLLGQIFARFCIGK